MTFQPTPNNPEGPPLDLESVRRLTRDLRMASVTLSPDEARFAVDIYYLIQDDRKTGFNQERALAASGEPHQVISWIANQFDHLEHQVGRALEAWTEGSPLGRWAKSITGIGPVIAAGLMAHIDVSRSETVGQLWRFAGLDPTLEWLGTVKARELIQEVCKCSPSSTREVTAEELAIISTRVNRKVERIRNLAADEETGVITVTGLASAIARRPWNTPFKTLCWKIGESFVKVQNLPKDFYGHLLAERKVGEWQRNLRGEYAEDAADVLKKKAIARNTEAFKWYSGVYDPHGYVYTGGSPELPEAKGNGRAGVQMLPPAHIHSRAKRWAVKMFLAHYHHVAYFYRFNRLPPLPYAITYLEHSDILLPPNMEMIDGLSEATHEWAKGVERLPKRRSSPPA